MPVEQAATDARHVLAGRIDALRQDLALAERGLTNTSLRADLRKRVTTLFGALLERQSRALKSLKDDVLKTSPSSAKGSLAIHWESFAKAADTCDRLLLEYRAFLEGALLRTAGLDDGVCDLADAFLRQLSEDAVIPWPGFTIMADQEFFAPLTDIIRLRYPHFSIWNLPVAAHEFGHFVTPRFRDRLDQSEPLKELRRRIRDDVKATASQPTTDTVVRHLNEYIADAFAAYAAGPSYVCATTLLRFDPSAAARDTLEHPSDSRRMHLLLRMLPRFNKGYGKLVGRLERVWQANLRAAGGAPPLETTWLDQLAADLADLLVTHLPKAGITAEEWLASSELSTTLVAGDSTPKGDFTVRMLLNAAWIGRLDRPDVSPTLINQKAIAWARLAPGLLVSSP